MITIKEIHDLKEHYVKTLYSGVREQQRKDHTFYDDTFPVPTVRLPNRVQRTGRGARLIDSPAEHIITSNPQAFREARTRAEDASALRISKMLNEKWISIMRRGNPQPFKEFVKNLLLRGEAWIHPIHNEKWVTGERIKTGLPVLYLIPDPMIIYADPEEDELGTPNSVIVFYERSPLLISQKYPNWSNPLGVGGEQKKQTATWIEYWDKDVRYFEADGQPMLQDEIQENIYHFVPFIHSLSGFGKSSPEGKLEELIVGRLRKVRDILTEECAMTSDIDSIMHLYANKRIDFRITDPNTSLSDDFPEQYDMGPGVGNIIPYGVELKEAITMLPSAEAFQHLYSIRAQLEREDPLVMAGLPVGSSGRQQDIAGMSAMRRYDTILENTEYAFAAALGLGLRMIEKMPGLYPSELNKDDINKYYECSIKLRAADPIEDDRKATLGSRLYQQGEIDLRTNLVLYQGYSQEDAEDIITQILVDKVTLQSPDIAELIGLRAAEKSGMAEDLEIIKARRQQLEAQQKGLTEAPMPTEAGRRTGEVETPMGREMIDEALRQRGARHSPERYTRE